MDYTYYHNGGSVTTNQIIELDYAHAAKKVTAGVKKVDFIITYSKNASRGGSADTDRERLRQRRQGLYRADALGETPRYPSPSSY